MKLKLLNLYHNRNHFPFLLPGTRTIRWAGFLLLSFPLHAQVVIKEKVEIEPQGLLTYNPSTNAHNVRIEVQWEALVVPANNHFYNANLYVKTEAKDNCENTVGINDWTYGWPSGTQVININNANAYAYDLTIGIDGFYDAYQFVDITMRVYVDNTLDRNESWQIMGNVPTHYEYRRCWVWITDKFNFRIQYPDLDFMGSITDMNYNPDYDCSPNPGASLVTDMLNLTILNGTEFVSFYDSRTGETIYGSIQVNFNELSDIDIQYDRPLYGTEGQYVVIEAESNGIVERDSVKIKPLDYQLEVILEPDTLAPGETATVTVKKRNNDGTITDFDAGQTFEVGMLDGCVLGNIFVGADSGKYFYDVPQPITFKAAVNAEAGVVKLRIGLIEQIGGISKGIRGTGNELTTEKGEARTLNFNRLRKPTTTNQPPTSPENTENYCPGVTPTQPIFKDADVVVGGDWIELLEPNQESEDLSITAEPSMPNLHIKLRIRGLTQGTLRCSLKVNWKNLDQSGHPVYGATFEIPSQDPNPLFPIYEWDMNWDTTIVGGEDINLDVEYVGFPYRTRKKTLKLPIKILGKDQIDKQDIKNYIATHYYPPNSVVPPNDQILQMQIIVLKESTWKQFKNNGYPNVKYHPHDWGLTQMSVSRPPIDWLWNWKANINAGIHHLYSVGYAEANELYNQERIKKANKDIRYFNHDELLKFTSQRYKGWWYYVEWIPGNPKYGKKGYWRENSVEDWKAYGIDFWDKFGKIKAGNPDPSWGW